MPLVRILIDGYSLLHCWAELAAGQARFSAAARAELIRALTAYRDAVGTPITVIFDGGQSRGGPGEIKSSRELEILYSPPGYTADDLIERAAARLTPYGEVLVVTDDLAERETIQAFGALGASCENFIRSIELALHELNRDLERHNRTEAAKFKQTS